MYQSIFGQYIIKVLDENIHTFNYGIKRFNMNYQGKNQLFRN